MRWDHPRLRGKDMTLALSIIIGTGSPPLTRERLQKWDNTDSPSGITPAYAGKTTHFLVSPGMRQDHPRLRGKNAHFPI